MNPNWDFKNHRNRAKCKGKLKQKTIKAEQDVIKNAKNGELLNVKCESTDSCIRYDG